MTDWHDAQTDLPPSSGYYEVEDRRGRTFVTWYEATINGFNMIHEGTGYKITRWRQTDERI